MRYPSKDEFAELLDSGDHKKIVEDVLIRGIPFAFSDSPGDYDLLRTRLGAALQLSVETMTVIGSGRTGFSLNPEHYGVPFSSESDLDVVVVSADLFDTAWLELLRLGRKYLSLDRKVRPWIDAHREGNIFWGYMIPDRLQGAVALSWTWFRTFKGLARNPSLAGRDVNGRLYRTWDHVHVHQLYSLRKVHEALSARRR